MNHFSRCCRSGKPFTANRQGQIPPPTARRGRYTHVSELDMQPTQEPTDVFCCETVEMFYCESIDKPKDVHEQDERFAELSACNTGRQLTMKIDTGTKCNIISKALLQHIDPTAHINLSKRAVIQQEAPELTEYKDLLDTSTIGKLSVVYHMRLDDTVHPAICAPRRVPLAMKDRIVTELHRMTRLGVITPVQEPTEWVSAIVAVSKRDGSIRLCIDPVNPPQTTPPVEDCGRGDR